MTIEAGTYIPRRAAAAVATLWAKFAFVVLLWLTASAPVGLFAYTPESPQVKSTIKKGIAYLDSQMSKDPQPGAQALAGIAMVKCDVPADNPQILAAVKAVKELIPDNDPKMASITNIYTVGMSIIFLVELDPVKYKPEIDCLLQFLYAKQKKHGGWGYFNRETGDTSMTQYGVLSSWEAKQAGFNVPPEALDGVADWLLRTQDPSGGFAYQGTVAPEGTLVPQGVEVRHSMTAAGAGSLYVLTNLFQMDVGQKKKSELPTALKEVRDKEARTGGGVLTRITPKAMHEAHVRANEWMKKNYTIEPPFHYEYYYLYALERYMSFHDEVEQISEKEPKWYNDGVEYILKHQAADGSFNEGCGPTADTAFAVLFLIRSTRKAIEKAKHLGSGDAIGGRGLPKPGEHVESQNGVMVVKPDLGPADDLLKMLDNTKEADYEKALEMMSNLPSQQAESLLSKYGDKLRKLTREHDADARMAAVVALGKTRNLDNVPALIYALTDPDREVVIEARKALERISRNPTGFGPIDNFSEEQRQTAVQKWKNWYLSLRPDADVDF